MPVNEDNVEDFDLFGDEPATGPRIWRVNEVIGDYTRLKDGVNYGIVNDLVFDQSGKLQSIIVNPSVGYGVGGYYGYPWYGYDFGFDPGSDYYDLPYGRDEVAEFEPLDDDMFDDDIL